MKRNVLLTACLVFTTFLYASWQIPVYNYTQKEYGAGTQNWQIKQQHNGWIYCANNYGLLEFDGSTWSLYGIWNSSVIRSIAIADDGTIYVGGTNEFGRFKSTSLGTLSYEPLSQNIPEANKNFGEVWNIIEQGGNLIIQTRDYIFKLGTDSQTVVVKSKSPILTSSKINDGIYIATQEGIYLLSGTKLNALRGSEQLRGYTICSLQPYGANRMLIGTDFGGIYLFDGEAINRFPTDADAFMRLNQLYCLTVGRKHIGYGTVRNGLVITDLNGKNCRYINTQNGLQNNTILSATFDDHGSLWLGLDQGVDRVIIDSPSAELYSKLNSYGSGYTTAIINGSIYLGTNQGLYSNQYPFVSDQRITESTLIGGSLGQVWGLDTVGNTLFCTHHRGLYIIDGQHMIPIAQNEGFWRVRPLKRTPNYAIAGAYSGLYLLKKSDGRWQTVGKIKGIDFTARVFEIDNLNRIWIVSDKGVSSYQLSETLLSCSSSKLEIPFRYQNDYFNISKIDDRIIISNDNECRIVDAKGQLYRDAQFFALLDGEKLYACLEKDRDNNLWYIIGGALKVRQFNKETGLYRQESIQIWNQPHMIIGGFANLLPIGNGQAITGTTSGFTLNDVGNVVRQESNQRHVFIRKVVSTLPQDSLIYGESFPIVKSHISIPYKNHSLRIVYGGTLDLDESDEYRVQLVPLDTGFGAWSYHQSKEYTTLPAGHYTFKVQMRNNAGSSVVETEIQFTILPPWYRTWWAYLLQFCAVSLVVYGTIRYIRRKINAGKRRLARQKDAEMREKERIFNEQAHEREKEILRLSNDKIEFELKNKSRELASILLSHINKNEILIDIKQDLKKIADDIHDKNGDQSLRKIVLLQGKITRNIEQEIDWSKFEENFDMVNEQFVNRLTTQYPWLNKKERRLCVYIRIGLITKEIAPLMNLSIRGVEMLRYRMRQKMGLDRNDSLEAYFQNYGNDDIKPIFSENDEEQIS